MEHVSLFRRKTGCVGPGIPETVTSDSWLSMSWSALTPAPSPRHAHAVHVGYAQQMGGIAV
jgi:hypothetical protein